MSHLALAYEEKSPTEVVRDKITNKLAKFFPSPPSIWVRVKSENNVESITAKVRTDDGVILLAKEQDEDIEKGGSKVAEKLEKQLKKKNKTRKRKRGKWRMYDHIDLVASRERLTEFPFLWGIEPRFSYHL